MSGEDREIIPRIMRDMNDGVLVLDMQENLKRIFTGKYAGVLSIVISALVFGVLHIAYGLPYMLASSLLLGVLGVFYDKQGNIWGLCIIHYVLGEAATFLRYLI